MHIKKYILISLLFCQVTFLPGQESGQKALSPAIKKQATKQTEQPVKENSPVPQPVKQLLHRPFMRGAILALSVKDVSDGKELYAYQPRLEVTPASVMKMVTTAAALEILGEKYVFPTVLEYDGQIVEGVLKGNLYIKGSGDPTLGSCHVEGSQTAFLLSWLEALQWAGIKEIEGSIVSDEGCFDWEGCSWKWVNEDLGSYYGAASYGITIFDNNYKLVLSTGSAGTTPEIKKIEPKVPLVFSNHLVCSSAHSAEYYISGHPFSKERHLYGVVPVKQEAFVIRGDIPDPPLFLAEYFTDYLEEQGIVVHEAPACKRIWQKEDKWGNNERREIGTFYSPPLKRIVRIVNEVSQNLYADVLAKTLGNLYVPEKPIRSSSFEKGTEMIRHHWDTCGLDVSSLWMYDGCGLAVTDKLTADFLTDMLVYMQTKSIHKDAFYNSLPLAGKEGSVRNFLRGTKLEGKARLKSGSMSRVKSYSGYIQKGNKEYAIAIIINNYACEGREMNKAIESLLAALF
ncbi:D-alanyl-D-alanine carboxypeptidase/D-alanyl-D-alanine endopeptidase [Parabacteroides pacaensis]|uniref:D-alanyl-D-alanine carboxypeptidase/D-alanyl-D-alanine endopeptidase n=1 Tax=Parabacteroides pacaensis TaxID=2086575 RepID=UPI000D0FDA0C|nr:D-alanyl-D-alanine carboxypeptidase/D-alanyl-D-alanine-endopeptidase [Parabacteroides pacaensis]